MLHRLFSLTLVFRWSELQCVLHRIEGACCVPGVGGSLLHGGQHGILHPGLLVSIVDPGIDDPAIL